MRIAVLGPLEIDEGRTAVAPRDEVVLEALSARPGETVRAESLADAVWGEAPPPSWPKIVQGCVSRLRKVLGPGAIVTARAGYRLAVHRDDIDHVVFEDLLVRAGALLENGEPERARFASGQALALWRGDPLGRLGEWEAGRVEAQRLNERRCDAEDLYVESAIRAGRHADVLGELVRLVALEPTREHRWGLLARAQYQSGRQTDALATLQRARTTLVRDAGLDPGPALAELESAILRQDPSLLVAAATGATATCPYLGLVAYDVSDASAFFGRATDVAACLARLDDGPVLAVVGPSGSGKSSLVRAGVAAALIRDGAEVRIITPGAHPGDALASVPAANGSVLVVDQCEEALALDEASAERAEFFAGLVGFAARGRLVISLRADRLGELAAHPEFARLVESGLYLLGPLVAADLRTAIEGPAAQAGLRLEAGLVDLLVREAQGAPGALPLLSHVLRQTWRRREGDTLTVAGYTATGGVREAVARSAERLYRELAPSQQGMLHDLMVRLVSADEAGEPVRVRVARRSVAADEEHSAVVERLVLARLLSTDGDSVEIAHESLANAWPRLRSWLDDDVEGLRIMRHLAVAAESWDGLGRPDSELYRGGRLVRAVEWRDRAGPSLTAVERDFVAASVDLVDQEHQASRAQVEREQRLNRRLRIGLAAVGGLLAAALVAGGLAVTAGRRADREASSAEHQALVADARRLGAEALRSDAIDRSLLLAAAGVSLDDSVDTRNNLLATLDRAPALLSATRSAGRILHATVDAASDRVAVMAADGVGLELYDGATLRRIPLPERLVGGSVASRPDGRGYAVTIAGDLVESRGEPPVLLLDRDGTRSSVQLGGIPPAHHVLDMGFPRRWYLGFSPTSRWFTASLVPLSGVGPTLTPVWDLTSPGRPVTVLRLGDAGSSPVLSADGRTLYSGEYGPRDTRGRVLVTDVGTGRARQVLTPDDLDVRLLDDVLAQSPDGRTLAVGAGDEAVLLDTTTLRPRAHLRARGAVQSLAFSPDGTHVAATGGRLVVWDVSGEEPVEVLAQPGDADDPRFSRDGRVLHTTTVSGLLQTWDLTGERRFLRTERGEHLDWPDFWGRFSPDRTQIAYVAVGPRFRVRDVRTGRLRPEVAPDDMAQGPYNDIAWHPDGRMLTMTSGDTLVSTWDSVTGRRIASHRLAPAPSTEAAAVAFFTTDGRLLLVGSTKGRLHVLDARTLLPTRAPIRVYDAAGGAGETRAVESFAPSGDEHTVYLHDAIVDYVAGRSRPMPDLGYPVVALYPSPDGRRLIVDTGLSGVGLLDAGTLEWISRPNPAQAGLLGLDTTWSRDGSYVASVSDGRLSNWDGRKGTYLGTVAGPTVGSPAFTDDDGSLLVAGNDGTVVEWDLDPATWTAAACRLAGRPLSRQEWQTFVPGRAYRPVCPS